ncbi:MAG: GGDEF domain-containing protein [Alphaproteobacteria bacterium]|jgi:diguanylate cyclase (GGDEF)-like protein|nr:GGDEF domain-containing protein [Alphaproteobacteria bacterium]
MDDRPENQLTVRELLALKDQSIIDTSTVERLLTTYQQLRETVHEQRQEIEILQKAASTDVLTGLSNRRMFEKELSRSLATAKRHNRTHGLIIVDVDDFKAINDNLGHNAGDVVLQHVAKFLKRHTRPSDTVARLGGDEFAIVLLELVSVHQAEAKAEELMAEMQKAPCMVDGQPVQVSLSAGAYIFDGDAKSTRDILDKADHAMYIQKQLHHGEN